MSLSSWSKVLAAALFCFLISITALAQTSKTGPKYDKTKEVTVKGTVTEVREAAAPTDPVFLSVKASDKISTVQLAPKGYLQEIDCWIKVGDTVEVTGAKVTDPADEIIARQVVFGNNTMVLRDDKGVPIWETWKPGK